ncbi:unnamed protein product [Aureobasidium pullulans]|nr:unnamed protein product [Aureobasidium pullulans]
MELAFRLTEHTLESTATSDTVRATTRRDESIEDAEQRDIADAMSNYVYLAEHEVLICKEHGYAVRGLDSHLRLVHKSYASSSKKARAAIRQHYGGRNMPDPSTICPPEPGQPAIEHLSDPIPGYYCIYSHEYTTSVEDAQEDAPPTATDPPSHCGYTISDRTNIGKHCRNAHGWKSAGTDRQCWKDVHVQTFCNSSGKQKWFVVKTPDEAAREGVNIRETLPRAKQIQFDGIKGDFQRLIEQWQKEQKMLSDKVEKCENTGWWNKTRWREHLKNCNLIHLSYASRLPDKDEEGLLKVAAVIKKMVERGVSGLNSMPEGLRRWLRSAEMHKPDVRPLARLQNSESQERYTGYWIRMICYCLRVWSTRDDNNEAADGEVDGDDNNHHDTESDSDETNDDEDDPHAEPQHGERLQRRRQAQDQMYDARRLFPWNDQLESAIQKVWTSVIYEGDTSSVEDDQIPAMVELCKVLLFRKVWNDRFDSAMIHFMAVMGIDETNARLRDGNDYSYMIAGLVYVSRLVAAEALLPSLERENQGEAEFEAFLERRKEFFADGSMSVMAEMLSLLAYGKKIAKNFHAQGKLHWTRDGAGVALGSIEFTVYNFKSMARSALDDCEDYMWRDLMWAGRKEDRFVLDLDSIVDDMTVKKRGWYFGADPNQDLEARGLDWMLKRMLDSKHGKKMRSSRDGQWQSRLVADHLRRVDKFRELFLFCVHVLSGQPARGTEITSLRFRNGVANHRNVFVLDGRVMTVTSYHKSQAMLDMPKMVPRFLPWRLGQIAVIYLTHVRVFAELLSVQVQYGQGWSDYIWADSNGPWETQKLTDTMKRETAKRLKVKLHTQNYRHAAVFLGRRFVGPRFAKGYREEAEDPEEAQAGDDDIEEEGNAIELQKAGGFGTGAGRYAVRADILKYLNQESIDIFGDLSEVWHEFLELDHRDPKRKRRAEPECHKGGDDDNDDGMQNVDFGGLRKERLLKRLPASRRGAAGAAAAAAAAVDLTPFLQQSERQQREIEELRMKIKTQELELRFRQEQHSPKTPNIGLGIYNTNHGLPTPVTEESGNKNTTYGNTDTGSYDDNNNNPIYVEDDSQENEDLQHGGHHQRYPQQSRQQHQQYRLDDSPIVERGRRRLEQRQRFKRATPREQERAIRKALKLPMDDDDTTTKIRYRSKAQGEALQRIMHGDFSVLTVVLPTAGGKTLLFTAPACLEEDVGVTIVVVPFRKLIDETVRDARKTVGDCEEWSHSTVDPAALVIVSVDKMHDHFWSYARQMVEQGRLRRVVVDECHLLVTSHSWRPHLVELEKLKSLGVPMVMLTATLPRYMEVELRRSLGVGIGMMSLIRACTARENITYTVRQDIGKGKLVEETARVCEEVEDELCRARKEKAVIYCRSKKDCEEMAERLGCGLFYAGHVDGEETLEQWKAKGGFIVSTTALSTGLNYEAVKAVIHSGLPYGLIEFAQASGRAGRDPSERVDSIVLLEQGWEEEERRTRELFNEAPGPDGMAMIEYIKTEGCRRLVLGKYFDPAETVRECHDYSSDNNSDDDDDGDKDEPETETDGNDFQHYQHYQLPRRKHDTAGNKAPCDKCGGGMIAAGTEQVRQSELEKEMIEDAMNEIKLGCVICWMKSEQRDSHLEHGGVECEAQRLTITDEADETTIIDADTFRKQIKYAKGSKACRKCGISQKMCNTRQDAKQKCQWPGIAIPVLMTAVRDPIGRNIIRQAGFEAKRVVEEEKEGWKAYAVWCGQARDRRLWGEMVSNSMWVVKEFLVYKSGERMRQFDDDDDDDDGEDGTSSFEDLDMDMDLDDDDFILIDSGTVESANPEGGEQQPQQQQGQQRQGNVEASDMHRGQQQRSIRSEAIDIQRMLPSLYGAIRQDRTLPHVMEGLSIGGEARLDGENGSDGETTGGNANGSDVRLQKVLETVYAV